MLTYTKPALEEYMKVILSTKWWIGICIFLILTSYFLIPCSANKSCGGGKIAGCNTGTCTGGSCSQTAWGVTCSCDGRTTEDYCPIY